MPAKHHDSSLGYLVAHGLRHGDVGAGEPLFGVVTYCVAGPL